MKTNKRLNSKHYWIVFIATIGIAISFNVISSFASQQAELPNTLVSNRSETVETISTHENTKESNIDNIESPAVEQKISLPAPDIAFNNAVSKPIKLGHFPYHEAKAEDLVTIASYAQGKYQRYERLHRDAALALMQMTYAARDSGVWIVPVSGYRNIAKQDYLFKAQVKRRGSEAAAAKLSAPPGHSEHHSGYTVDLTDGHLLNQDITYKFASTEAYQWLLNNADKFGFELSFPENNAQGVSFEPWHWRYVGSPDALKTFAEAKANK